MRFTSHSELNCQISGARKAFFYCISDVSCAQKHWVQEHNLRFEQSAFYIRRIHFRRHKKTLVLWILVTLCAERFYKPFSVGRRGIICL